MNEFLWFLKYKLANYKSNFLRLMNVKRKFVGFRIIKEKKKGYVITEYLFMVISLFTLYMALKTKSIVWISLCYFFSMILGDFLKEWDVGHWKHWMRMQQKELNKMNDLDNTHDYERRTDILPQHPDRIK